MSFLLPAFFVCVLHARVLWSVRAMSEKVGKSERGKGTERKHGVVTGV